MIDPVEQAQTAHALSSALNPESDPRQLPLAIAREVAPPSAPFLPKVGAWVWDVTTGIVERSDACVRLLGCDGSRLIDNVPDDLNGFLASIHPEDRQGVHDSIGRALEGSGSYEAEYRAILSDGSTRLLCDRGDVFRGPTGQAVRLVVTTTEPAHVPTGSAFPQVRLDANGRAVWRNATWQELTGESDGPWIDAIHEEDRPQLADILELSSSSAGIECRIRRASDGEYVWFLMHFERMRDSGLMLSGIEIHNLKTSQLSSAATADRLKAALSEGHHRIKNNLQTITALIELHLAETRDTVPASVLQRLAQNIKSLASLHELLTAEASDGEDGAVVAAKAALDKLLPLLESAIGNRPLKVDCADIQLTLRQATGLTLLVTELVSNSAKHGRGQITITIAPGEAWGPGVERRSSPRARLEVTDEGDGFPPDFDPSKSAHTGLELVQMLARWDLGGQVFFANTREGGARVVVTFAVAGPPPPVSPVPRRRVYYQRHS